MDATRPPPNFLLVSINIPSYNSEKMIPFCLEGVKKQKYSDIETLVIDSYSTDRTRKIAKNCGAKIILCQGKLLESRILGVKESKGEYILFLDTDMILKEDTIERAVSLIKEEDLDMLVLEEESYNTNWFIPMLYSVSKKVVNARFKKSYAFDPLQGANPARFYKKEILEKAFRTIPKEFISQIIHYDHDIIYYESYKISKKVGVLRNAVYCVEPDFKKLWRTNFRYGASLRIAEKTPYWNLFLKKRGTGIGFEFSLDGFKALLLTLILRIVNKIGYYFGHT